MARCEYCRQSGLLLRTNSYGLCKPCREKVRSKSEVERERVKGDLISARFLKDPEKRVHHLRRALQGAKQLRRYEQLGCAQTSPSPRALKAFLEEKIGEALIAERPAETERATVAETTRSRGQAQHEEPPGVRGHGAVRGGSAPPPGTRRVQRHQATFGVWVDRTTPARSEDISSRGLCFRAAALLRPGTRVDVTVEAPDGQVSGEGMVRWAHPTEIDEHGTRQAVMGLEFLAPPPELQRYA